jgi:catechol 2,3-dioxygenase-like lactoylglutathione lyase family enzyme
MNAAIPVIRVSSSVAAKAFYCDKLGFVEAFAYRPDISKPDPCYMGLVRGGARVHVSSFESNGPTGMSVAFAVEDVVALHAEFLGKGVPIHMPPTDQTWGNREMYVRDPDDNKLAFIQERAG